MAARAAEPEPAWANAWQKGPMNAEETKAFMKRLAQFVFDNHLKKNPDSPQRGMIYEYFDTTRKGQPDQFVQGEALDTMHDGAWFAAALVNAYRTTGDPFYKEFLAKWILPFYLKMLNHSDELFSAKRNDARPDAHTFGKEWLLQEGEKGFVPYFWDDGGSVSLERRQDKNPLGVYQCVDHLAGKPNPDNLLNGYSLGSSNHMAQDLGVMLQLAWLLFRDSRDERDKRVAAEIAEAAKNLHECRMRHHGYIPMCVAPWALASGSADLMKRVPDPNDNGLWTPKNHYTRALYDFEPAKQMPYPGFADDQEYTYYHGIARAGGKLPKPLAFKTIYDAYTHPMLFRIYCDDWEVPPGINVFDLFPYRMVDGKPTDYRSERKGPRGTVKPVGSRFGPQNMVCCGWALQALNAYPGIWEGPLALPGTRDVPVEIVAPTPGTKLEPPEGTELRLAGTKLTLLSTRTEFRAQGSANAKELTVKVFSRPDGKGSHAIITIKAGGEIAAVNEGGEAIVLDGRASAAGDGTAFGFRLRYRVVKGQKQWANGVEYGRYSIQVGNDLDGWKTRNFYLASAEGQVKAWLERELGGGLRTWEAIFNEKGYIPTSIGSTYDWDKYSDTGAYAHLLSAAAQWLLCLQGKNDWEMHNIPSVPAAK
jgi:hypothetical protein